MAISKANIGQALHSVADDHVTAVANDIYDETLQKYQSEINAEVGQGDGVYDISAANPTNGNPTHYGDLQAALSAFTDTTKKKGGMTIKFIQGEGADAKYVQYRLLRTTFPSEFNEDDWEIAGGAIEVIDNLTNNSMDKPLSANQGRILAYNLQLLIESLANLAFKRVPSSIQFIDMNVDTGEFKYSVTVQLTGCTVDNTAPVTIGTAYSGVITPNSGYELGAVTITMAGADVTSTAYDGNGNIYIESVNGDIVITCHCIKDASGGFKVTYNYIAGTNPKSIFGANGDVYAISPKMNVVSGHTLEFGSTSGRDTNYSLIFFNKSTNRIQGEVFPQVTAPRRVSVPSDVECYARFAFKQEGIALFGDSMYVLDVDTNTYLLRGSELNLATFGSWDDYKDTAECPMTSFEDTNGNYPNCKLSAAAGYLNGVASGSTIPFIYVPLSGAFTDGFNTMCSKAVVYTSGKAIEFSVGATYTDGTNGARYGLVIEKIDGTVGVYGIGKDTPNRTLPSTHSVFSNARKLYLFFEYANIGNAYIKEKDSTDASDGTILWNGSDYVEQE